MKTIKEILDNYKEYGMNLGDRFGARFAQFLTIEQGEMIGFEVKDEYKDSYVPIEWTEANVIAQLVEDAKFGKEKAQDERGISSNLMYEVCVRWCKILGREDLILHYLSYGIDTFEKILKEFNGK